MDLSVTLKGHSRDLHLKNPVIAASGTFGSGLEYRAFGSLASLGGISVKGISLLPRNGNAIPRIVETSAGMLNSIGLQNEGVDVFLKDKLPLLPWHETAIIANLYATSAEDFGQLAARMDGEPGIAALELNVSCPNVRAGGSAFGADPLMTGAVVRAARENAPHKHIIVKLSPNVTDMTLIARSAEDAGADSISCINTLLGMAINIDARRPALANIVGGLSGPAIKPVALRCVWQVARAVKIPVIGLGGISSTDDILEFLMAGACAIQVGTANFMDPCASFAMVRDLPACLQAHGFKSLAACHKALVLD